MPQYGNILGAVGRTPLIRLNRIAEGVPSPIYVKAEFLSGDSPRSFKVEGIGEDFIPKTFNRQIVAGDDIYGGTYRLFEKVFKPWGIQTSCADVTSVASFEKAITEKTWLIWVETPTNPLLKIADLESLLALAHAWKTRLVVDNMFASPYFQRPLELGAHMVVHSTTKYLGGHSDILGGAVITSDDEIYQSLKSYQNAVDAVPGPWDCWLTLRGIKTLAARRDRARGRPGSGPLERAQDGVNQ